MFTNQASFKVAVVQDSPIFLDLGASVEKACRLIGEAAATGAKLIVFSETWLPGYPVWLDEATGAALWDHPPAKAVFRRLFENSPTIPGPEVGRLGQAAKEAGAVVVLGLHERDGGTLYNTMVYLGSDGRVLGKHRKLVLTYTERLVWGRGDGSTLTVVETDFGRIGGLVCWEHWMPLARAAMHRKGELVHVAQWPSVKEMHQVASRQYAFEGGCFVVAAGTILRRRDLSGLSLALLDEIPGEAERLLQFGGSAIISPNGDYLAGPIFDEIAILTAEIDPNAAIEGRLTLDTDGHYARPDVFQLYVNEKTAEGVTFE